MEFKISLDSSSLKPFNITQGQLDTYINRCLNSSCELVQLSARKNHKFKSESGRLERAIMFKIAKDAKEGTIYIDDEIANYGKYVHEPTGIYGSRKAKYEIKPKNGSKLAFFWKRHGKFVILDKVMHPGSRADYFLPDALKKNKKNITEIFRKELVALIQGGIK